MDPTHRPAARAVPGATSDNGGITFSLRAPDATAVELSLFDEAGGGELRIGLDRGSRGHWSADVPGLRHGQLYGFRVHGPHDPPRGH